MINRRWIIPLVILLILGCTSPVDKFASKQVNKYHYQDIQITPKNITEKLPEREILTEIKQQPEKPQPLQKISGKVTIIFLDVGQGDSIFIDYKDYEILIDAGASSHGKKVCAAIKPYVDGALDLAIATHPHTDHIGGFCDVVEKFNVLRLIDSGASCNTKAYQEFLLKIKSHGIVRQNDADQIIQIAQGVSFRIYELADNEKNINNDSVVTELIVGNKKFLFTGDMESDIETRYLKEFHDIDVLKISHHGSSTASSDTFLKHCTPENAVISCGKNNCYRHPQQEVLERFDEFKTRVYRTDVSGTITITCDGASYQIITQS